MKYKVSVAVCWLINTERFQSNPFGEWTPEEVIIELNGDQHTDGEIIEEASDAWLANNKDKQEMVSAIGLVNHEPFGPVKPDKDQITQEIWKLTELKPKIHPRTAFGDSNTDAIQAEIDTLQRWLDKPLIRFELEDWIYETYENNDHARSSALSVLQWLEEGQTDGGETSIFEGWLSLVR